MFLARAACWTGEVSICGFVAFYPNNVAVFGDGSQGLCPLPAAIFPRLLDCFSILNPPAAPKRLVSGGYRVTPADLFHADAESLLLSHSAT
jgi:hypothetical protein